MISVCGSLVALLGGWRGDRLWLSLSGGPFRLLAELGWDEEKQTTPQRRILLTPDACFVLEPADGSGPMLEGSLRVRRVDFDGQETGREVGEDAVAEPWSEDWAYFLTAPNRSDEETCLHCLLCGIDTGSGRARRWLGSIEMQSGGWGLPQHGVALMGDEGLHLALPDRGLLTFDRSGGRLQEGCAGTAVAIPGRGVCAGGIREGVSGLWVGDTWRALPGPAPYPGTRPPLAPLVASHGEGGVALLRARGGALGVIDGSPAELPEGLYGGLVALPEGLFGLTEGDSPRLVAAAF